uniref:hypothetical protein n=1 Tax=Clostridium sp. 12(A) TaxID=1163671 RepID=UPI000463BBCB|nr:hypothetical protein [Clostridium sp. 12(A)]
MAKYGVTNIAGGGGIGSDEVSVTKEYVLNGKTYVGSDTSDEISTGTMVNNGATGNQNLNAGGSFSVKKGYHAQDFTVNANNLVSQTQGTATSAHILSGQTAWVNGNKINGGIPIQKGDAAQDQVWSTNWTTSGDGNIFMGVRNGHYLNGVNWIRANVPNFIASNIKKGVSIGGIIGTFEGYVPIAADLYLRGNNIANWISENSATFDTGQISSNFYNFGIGANLNLVGKTQLNVQGIAKAGSTKTWVLTKKNNQIIQENLTIPASGQFTYSFNISAYQVSDNFKLYTYHENGSNLGGMYMAIYRIWLS